MADFTPQFSSIGLLADVDACSYHINHTVCFKHVCSLMFMGIRIDLIIHKRTAHFHMIKIIFNLIKNEISCTCFIFKFFTRDLCTAWSSKKKQCLSASKPGFKMNQKGTKLIQSP